MITSSHTQSPTNLSFTGAGGVGKEFLRQLAHLPNAPTLVLVSNSSKTVTSPAPQFPAIPALDWHSCSAPAYAVESPRWTESQIITYLSELRQKTNGGRCVVVDNTSDPVVANSYPSFLASGISVVTPNKKAFSSTFDHWKAIFTAAAENNALVYHESSVGAGLPIISTLRDLIATGDRVLRIEGVFTGTLSYLFNNFSPVDPSSAGGAEQKTWSSHVAEARRLGYTEPDPRDDLNGMDVARKCTILARVAGVDVTGPDSFPVDNLIPQELRDIPSTPEGITEFMARLADYDQEMEKIKNAATEEGKVVRYVGAIDVETKEVTVSLRKIDKDSSIAGLKGSDNIINFYTERYGKLPLVIQGAGAGGAVTAMGVTADLLKVSERLS